MSFYQKFYNTFHTLVEKVYRIETVGRENIPEGGAILASNHTAFSDVIVISAASTRQVRYMAKKELFKIPLLAPLIKALGAYPVDRGGADVGSLKKTIGLVTEGELVGIFPQGHRYGGQDPRTTEIKSGVGMIAYHTKAVVVPVFVDSKSMKTKLFCKNTVTFGKPIAFEELAFKSGGRTEYMNASRIVFDRICAIKYGSELPSGEKAVLAEPKTAETAETAETSEDNT